MYTINVHQSMNSRKQQNIRMNLYGEFKIPFMWDAICMIPYKVFSTFCGRFSCQEYG